MSNAISSGDLAESPPRRFARHAGIELEYKNARDKQVRISDEVLRSLLATMGLKVATDADAQAHLKRIDEDGAAGLLPSTVVVRNNSRPLHIRLNLRGQEQISWRLKLEDGRTEQGEIAAHGTSTGRVNGSNERPH